MGVILLFALFFARHNARFGCYIFEQQQIEFKKDLKEFIIKTLLTIGKETKSNGDFDDFVRNYTRFVRNDSFANVASATFSILGVLGVFVCMIKTVDSVLLLWIEWALNNEAEAKADVAGVFAANEDWLSARVVIDWHVEFLAFFEIPIFEHLDDFLFATTQTTGDDKLHIIGSMSATMVLTDIFEFNIIDSLKTLRVSEDFFTKFLLEFWPDEATIVVLVTSKLRAKKIKALLVLLVLVLAAAGASAYAYQAERTPEYALEQLGMAVTKRDREKRTDSIRDC